MKVAGDNLIRISKTLSLVLRHQPETIGLTLDKQGWADVVMLIEKMNNGGFELNKGLLQQVIDTNNKSRFTYNDDKTKIRANQGHSIDVDLGYTAAVPPEFLFHGTGEKFIANIMHKGLLKINRHQVHLSSSKDTALKVGQRKGKPVILKIDALKMHHLGFTFFISPNNVWLTDHVPASYINIESIDAL